jgi:hypothetical protein
MMISSITLTIVFLCFLDSSIAGPTIDIQGASQALEIGKIVCTPDPSHDKKWFKCIECCQSINVYHLVSESSGPDFDYNFFVF